MEFSRRLSAPELISAYRERSLLLGREITWQQDGETRRARALDVDAQGGLVVENESGERLTLRSGEVFQIRPV